MDIFLRTLRNADQSNAEESFRSLVTHQRKALVSKRTCMLEFNFHSQRLGVDLSEEDRQNHQEQRSDLDLYQEFSSLKFFQI